MVVYHDEEWGVPAHDDRTLFEFLLLDSFQAGLSWAVILRKRAAFREAFADFDPVRVAEFGEIEVRTLLENAGIVRNRQKILATISNAAAFLEVQREFGSFDRFIWQFVGGAPIQNRWRALTEIPASTGESEQMSRELKRRGFSFVGSTICYAFMQGAGLVNDHVLDCFRHPEIESLSVG
jgi:DNA-3-methyladenine glycosylase I